MAVVIIISFFLPWISIEAGMIGGLTRVLKGNHKAVLNGISGFKIPILAYSDESHAIINMIKIFSPAIRDTDKKSFLIWLVPVLALIIFLANRAYGENRWINLLFALIGIAIFTVAVYKMANTDLDKLVFKAKIAWGLWATLWAYLGIGLLGLINFVKLGAERKDAPDSL